MTPLVSREGAAGPREPAEQDCSVRTGDAVARAVGQLPWLAPAASSLAALCHPSADLWQTLRFDPGLVVLLLRQPEVGRLVRLQTSIDELESRLQPAKAGTPTHQSKLDGSLVPSLTNLARARLQQPTTLEEALGFLHQPPAGFVDWSRPGVEAVYRFCRQLASYAESVAQSSRCCSADDAWIAGFMAPLGWLAVAAASPRAVADCLNDPEFTANPLGTQRKHWGLDHAALARRLARRWRLPDQVAAVAGCLALPVDAARPFGADPGLFHAVRTAVAMARRDGFDLGLDGPEIPLESKSVDSVPPAPANPYEQPWLRDLLKLAAENQRLRDDAGRERLDRELDVLHEALRSQVAGEAERLRQSKVAAMAEFAAGAGHEINNPLAVISGQAQYLLGHEADWFREDAEGQARRALHTIIAQTRRIHGLLRDLMLYARPARPRPARVDLPTLLGEVAASCADLAGQRQVRIELVPGPDRLPVFVDADQVRTALGCLLRNALEAAPAGGWVRLALVEPVADDVVEVAVEDSGPGPDSTQIPSLFDPLFSGRSAGRGKGLGLPIAWRLARQHGGDVRLDRQPPAGPTRFVLRLARVLPPEMSVEVLAPDALSLPSSPVRNGQARSQKSEVRGQKSEPDP